MPFAEMKPVRVNTFEISSSDDMTPALVWSRGFGFYGMINLSQDGEWLLSITKPGEERSLGRVDVKIGEVMIWDGANLSVMARDVFLDIYETNI